MQRWEPPIQSTRKPAIRLHNASKSFLRMIGGCLGSKVDPGPSAERSDQMRRRCLRKPSASATVGIYSCGCAISMRRIGVSIYGIYQTLQTCQPDVVPLSSHTQQIRMSPLARGAVRRTPDLPPPLPMASTAAAMKAAPSVMILSPREMVPTSCTLDSKRPGRASCQARHRWAGTNSISLGWHVTEPTYVVEAE